MRCTQEWGRERACAEFEEMPADVLMKGRGGLKCVRGDGVRACSNAVTMPRRVQWDRRAPVASVRPMSIETIPYTQGRVVGSAPRPPTPVFPLPHPPPFLWCAWPPPQNTAALSELKHLVDKYRQFGHLDANWDPLKMWKRKCVRASDPFGDVCLCA